MSELVVIGFGSIAAFLMAVSLVLSSEEEGSIAAMQRLAMSCLLFGILVCLYEIAFNV